MAEAGTAVKMLQEQRAIAQRQAETATQHTHPLTPTAHQLHC